MRLSSVLSCVVVTCGALAGCSYMDDPAPGSSPSSIRDAYLIAHGMAESYRDQAHADPKVLAELSRLDAQAAAAVRGMDGTGSPDASARAVAALTDYADQQTSAAQ